jgi:hypothetical protein
MEIRPEDSISNVDSREGSINSRRSRTSSRSSVRSSASAKARATARKAILEAEAAALERLYVIQEEELRLQQRKKHLELQTNIAKAEAEERAYAIAEAEENKTLYVLDETHETRRENVNGVSTPAAASELNVTRTSLTNLDRVNEALQNPENPEQSLNPFPLIQTPRCGEENLNPTVPERNYAQFSAARDNQILGRVLDSQERQSFAFQQLLENQQQNILALTLPQPDVPVFDGDPTRYCDFVRAFENLIERKTNSPSARLYYLVQYTSGQVKELMSSCLSMQDARGYYEARRLLLQRYGQPYKIATAFVDRLTNGPQIKAEDGPGLQKFSTLLTSCKNTLQEIGYINKLENPDNMRKIVERLPFGMKAKWRETVDSILQREERDVNLKDIAQFIETRARVANHPIFGKITSDTRRGDTPSNKGKQHQNVGRNYAIEGKEERPFSAGSSTKRNSISCPSCCGTHWLSQCDKFKGMSVDERYKFVRSKKLCINCLTPNHFVKDCPKKSFCRIQDCPAKHSTFLHLKDKKPANDEAKGAEEDKNAGAEVSNNGYVTAVSNRTSNSKEASTTGLAVVPVKVRAKGGNKLVKTYAFLDSGSNTTFCTEQLLNELGIKGTKSTLSLTTLETANALTECSIVNLEILDLNEDSTVELPKVFSRPSLPISRESVPNQRDVNRWPHLKGINIPRIDAEVGLLIGSDVPEVLQPREVRESKDGGPFATRTIFGWVLNGPLGRNDCQIPTANFVQANAQLNQQFEQFCNREFDDSIYESKISMSQNDQRALKIMEDTVKLTNGHYEMALPWKNYPPCLQNNKSLAQRRLNLLKRKLEKDPTQHDKYKDFMNDLLRNGYARRVYDHHLGPLDTHWYLPHHAVFHPQKPGKIRVVFDCSANYRGTSLNDQLLQGPDLTNSLVGVITRFRQDTVAFMADVEAMFHQVRVRPTDCDALRFLWWPDGNLASPPEEYQMTVHLFGAASSPSCANFALKRVAKDHKAEFDDETIRTVNKNFYVDDCLKSVGSNEKAIRLANQLRNLLAMGGFRLTKWISNSEEVLKSLPESERATVKNLDLSEPHLERALGVHWNVTNDEFVFQISVKDKPPTRRGILSIVSSVYDPLGFAAPFILQAKLIMQDLCRKNLGWDDEIPKEDLSRWQDWLKELPKLEQLAVKRCFQPRDFGEISSCELHHFSDASQKGYGAVSYLKIVDKDGKAHCSFVMGKSRLTPLKAVTIPRMELSAAVVAARLDRIIRSEIDLEIDESYFWTDSTCVLRYVHNEATRFQTFVANRITKIRELSSPSQWRYVDTHSNPADDASRGVPADCLERWLHGPSFLAQSSEMWPKQPEDLCNLPDDQPELKKSNVCAAANTVNPPTDVELSDIFDRFSSWIRLKKTIAWVLRYITNLRNSVLKRKSGDESNGRQQANVIAPITTKEMMTAEREILKYVQAESFNDELDNLRQRERQPSKTSPIRKKSSLYKLDPTLEDGLLRVGGRLRRAHLDHDAKHPVILPKKHHVSNLIINHYHLVSGHSGLEYTLSLIRQSYWIIGGRANVRRIANDCFSCRRRQAPAQQQKMSDLPEDRVVPCKRPFTYVGVDCFGPFVVRRGRSDVKRYGVIFTCLSIRAIHIEVAHSLDTESFINALRRFVSRRGTPEEIRSDNGGNFVKGEKELREAIEKWNQQKIHESLLQKNIKWIFNPPAGSHTGGVWERCIRTVRKIFNALVKEQTMNDEQLNTLMCEVESIVNGRPITKVSDDPKDSEALTPNHLLLLHPGPSIPPGRFSKADNCNVRRWRQVQYLADLFWRRWLREYLPSLQQRQKWNELRRNVKVNDIVLVLDERTPRSSWPLGRILEVNASKKDGLVRSAKIKTSTTVMVRPINKLILLEQSANDK